MLTKTNTVLVAFLLTSTLASCGGDELAGWAQVCDPDDPHPEGPACLQRLTSDDRFDAISISEHPPFERGTKYMVPVRVDPASRLLPPLLQNTNRFQRHMDFLSQVFPERFGDLTVAQYKNLIFHRRTREYYSGNVYRIKGDEPLYGFEVYSGSDEAELLRLDEVRQVHKLLSSALPAGRRLAFVVDETDARAVERAKGWIDPGFPLYFRRGGEMKVEVYTPAVSYGRIRLFTLEQFDAAASKGQLTWQDIVVIDRVPFDIEAVVAGVVTGRRQWLLSHVNVRMARRGTPNLYVQDPLSALKKYAGALMRLEAVKGSRTELDYYSLAPADPSEAAAWWAAHRPKLSNVPTADTSYRELDDLLQMDLSGKSGPLVSKFGGKAANLAQLYGFLPAKHRVAGLAIPFAWFEDFMSQNTLVDSRHSPPKTASYRQYINSLLADKRFGTDAPYRRAVLSGFRATAEKEGQIDPALVKKLADRIKAIFGSAETKVRFRSSSNVEDALEFSGAGLYSSTSVCVADSLDGDQDGPSRCDKNKSKERTIERGLRRVWTSLYNVVAWEERDWYQVPQDRASMAILVTMAFPDEIANGVAFTGNPSAKDDARYLINAQQGDEPVVGNDPKIMPEKDLLTVKNGKVVAISRARASSLVAPGTHVLSDARLEELGGVMATIDKLFPLELGEHQRSEVLLDLEFKIDRADGGLKIKQIRPFLRPKKHD